VNDARYASWQYRLGSGDGPPGVAVTLTGDVALTTDERALRQSILLLIATIPGERIMRPTYGCDLDRLAFLPNDDTTAGLAMHAVRSAIERWEPRAEIVSLDANRDPDDPTTLLIELRFKAKTGATVDSLTVSTSVAGGA
jgi:phage baseplate assembly protein W